MDSEGRPDIRTRFKKGQSGNPRGRPRGRKNDALLIKEAFFKPIRVSDGHGSTRTVPKIVAAAEVCINKALKGDLAAFTKVMTWIDKFKLIPAEPILPPITEIREILVHPPIWKEAEEDKQLVAARDAALEAGRLARSPAQ
jgi:hypothetical protein